MPCPSEGSPFNATAERGLGSAKFGEDGQSAGVGQGLDAHGTGRDAAFQQGQRSRGSTKGGPPAHVRIIGDRAHSAGHAFAQSDDVDLPMRTTLTEPGRRVPIPKQFPQYFRRADLCTIDLDCDLRMTKADPPQCREGRIGPVRRQRTPAIHQLEFSERAPQRDSLGMGGIVCLNFSEGRRCDEPGSGFRHEPFCMLLFAVAPSGAGRDRHVQHVPQDGQAAAILLSGDPDDLDSIKFWFPGQQSAGQPTRNIARQAAAGDVGTSAATAIL